MSTKKLGEKVALVTGGARGIGAAIAKRLAADGASVAITYGGSKEKAETVAHEIEKAGGKAFVLHGDANKPETMQAVVDKVVAHYGKLDMVVNNAGILEGTGSVEDAPLEALDRTININIKSAFTITQAAAKVLPSGGRIINLSSVVGERGIFPGVSIYAMSKFALRGLTRAWAHDLAPKNITVNTVLPGPIATEMGVSELAESTALKPLRTPKEIAAVIAVLPSPEASYVTGAEVRVDGGMNA